MILDDFITHLWVSGLYSQDPQRSNPSGDPAVEASGSLAMSWDGLKQCTAPSVGQARLEAQRSYRNPVGAPEKNSVTGEWRFIFLMKV